MLGTYTLSPGPSGTTKVTYTYETEPSQISDKLMDTFGGRSWSRRKAAKALRRLRSILEEGRDRGERVSVAGD
jgi:hypothetical protein